LKGKNKMGQLASQMSQHYRQLKATGLSHESAFSLTGQRFASQVNKPRRLKMLKTKSIFDEPDEEDGIRISVMRWHYPPEKYKGRYDEWCRDLAPSAELLRRYKRGEIDWDEYEKLYNEEMKAKTPLIKKLAERAAEEEITLLCAEKTDEKCHRRLLQNMLEQFMGE